MAKKFITLTDIDKISDQVRTKLKARGFEFPPNLTGMILGSGLGPVADAVLEPALLEYTEIDSWPTSTVHGHAGRLVAGTLEGQPVLVMQGRVHYYEGYSIQQIGLPVRVLQRLGATTLIVTNAAGAVNPDYAPGDLMLILDHLNLIGMAGLSPLRGPNIAELGPRFPDMSQAYDRQLGAISRQVAKEAGITLHEGVYAGLAGPSFETPADLRFLRTIGTDAVGMSTVPEVTVARHGGMRVLGVSGISNKANLDGNTITTHEEVLEAGKTLGPKLETLVRGVLQRMS